MSADLIHQKNVIYFKHFAKLLPLFFSHLY